ncbi:MAG: sigma 54-interacting transcriptional regulator [Desulfatirhabdiaceae bacterium]
MLLNSDFFSSDPDQSGLSVTDWKAFSQALTDASQDGVCVIHPSGNIIFSNQAAREKLNLFPGTKLESVCPQVGREVSATLQDHKHRFGISVQFDQIHYLAKVSPVYWNEQMVGALCVFENSTELEKITQQMLSFQELSRELDMIIESSYDGLWICDGDANVLRINSASERLNGIKAASVVGKNMKDLVTEGFVNRSATLEVIDRQTIVNLLQKTNLGRKLMITGNPLFDDAGNLIRVVVNERDITEIDALHEELERQEALKNQYRNHMVERQIVEMASRQIIARTPCMENVLQQAVKVGKVDATVLILGESGVGKELIAEMIHRRSERARKPMIKINCGAIPESLLEAELFGYDRGAFTGASKNGKPGYLEMAHEGVLFMDEIAELPLLSQVKLLRFLEDGQVTRIGGTRPRQLNVRILAATNRDLKQMVADGRFRRDLFYRLHVIPITIPPLRERKDCILPLLQHYLEKTRLKMGRDGAFKLSKPATEALMAYTYPGNVRELINICEQVVVMGEGDVITLNDLPSDVLEKSGFASLTEPDDLSCGTLKSLLERYEQSVLLDTFRKCGTQEKTARALGVDQSTIARKLKRMGRMDAGLIKQSR